MNENQNPAAPEEKPEAGSKTFSQEDVNRIVQERLSKERARSDAAFTQREQALAAREFQLTAKEALAKAGLPVVLADALDKSSPEAFEKALEIVSAEMGKRVTPDRGGAFHDDHFGYDGQSPDASLRKAMGLQKKG